MKNFKVKATINFTDYEGLECIPENPHKERAIGDIFECTKERAKYLVDNNAVEIIKIPKNVENVDKPVEKKTRKKKDTVK